MSQGFRQTEDESGFPTGLAETEDRGGSFAAYTSQPNEYITPEASLDQFTMPVSFGANSPFQYMPSTQVTQSSTPWGDAESVASIYCNNYPLGQHLQPANRDSGAAINHIPISRSDQLPIFCQYRWSASPGRAVTPAISIRQALSVKKPSL
jgi:hypothetical protein